MTDNNKVLLGIFAGLATGVVLALLLAPEKGSDLREKLSDGLSSANEELKDTFAELKGQVEDYVHAFEKDIRKVVQEHLHNLTEKTDQIIDKEENLVEKAFEFGKELSN